MKYENVLVLLYSIYLSEGKNISNNGNQTNNPLIQITRQVCIWTLFFMKKQLFYLFMSGMVLTSCATHHYQVSEITHNRILIDERYDNVTDAKAEAFIAPYKVTVDSIWVLW